LVLNSGGAASYTSGSGTAALTFTYTVGADQTTSGNHLDAASSAALSGTIQDAHSNPATLTVPVGATAGSLSSNAAILIDAVAPQVVSYSLLFGSQSYNVIGSTRTDFPWQISGIQVVFSKPIASANVNSLTGLTVTALSGVGTTTLTWTISPVSIGIFSTALVGSGANVIADQESNPLAGGSGFTQSLPILWGDFNGDGVVNAQDLVGVNNARSGAYNIFADMNGDGVVNVADVEIVRLQVGTSLP
jgi:Dockerin type I domain